MRAPEPKSRLKRAISASSVNVVVFSLFQLASVPVFLTAWKTDLYGEWIILFTLPAYLGMADLGMQSAVGTSITMLSAAGNKEAAQKQFSAYFTATCVLALGLIGVVTFAIASLPIRGWLRIDLIAPGPFGVAFLSLAAYAALSLPCGAASAGYRANLMFHRGMWAVTLLRSAEYAWIIGSVSIGWQPDGVASGLLAVRATGSLLLLVDLNYAAPWLHIRTTGRMNSLRTLVWPAIAYLGFPFGNVILNQGVLLAVNYRAGSALVVVVNTARSLSNAVHQLIGIGNASASPEYSIALGKGDISTARSLRDAHLGLAFAGATVIAIGLSVVGIPFVRAWTRGQVQVPVELLIPLVTVAVLDTPWYALSTILDATNEHMNAAMAYLITASISVAGIALTLRPDTPELIGIWLAVTSTGMTWAVVGAAGRALGEQSGWSAFAGAISWLRATAKSPTSALRS